MRIRVRRTGGFAGLDEALHDIDTKSIGGSDRAELETVLLGLEAAANTAERRAGADFLRYELTLAEAERERTFAVADDGSELAQRVRRLLDRLSALAPGTAPKR